MQELWFEGVNFDSLKKIRTKFCSHVICVNATFRDNLGLFATDPNNNIVDS